MSNLLRIATAGSVDDGKSTLIGRLLHDSKAIFEDQMDALAGASRRAGGDEPDLALLTDGLRAEREQGITIDVAYRYFASPRRKFIIADTPGHVQYTRNMVTGASTADVALVLVDARHGVAQQSRRHAFLAGLLGIRHVVVCINKMDLVDWSANRFEEIRAEFEEFAAKLEIGDLSFVPVSALTGENVVSRGTAMPWYEGAPLLGQLEALSVSADRNLIDTRLPVQYVLRTQEAAGSARAGFRGCAGTVAAGTVRRGDAVVVAPAGTTTTLARLYAPGGREVDEAAAGEAVAVELADDLDVGRGDMICRPANQPEVTREIEAMVCWFAEESELAPGHRYVLQHTSTSTEVRVDELSYRLDVDTLHREDAGRLALNDIGRVRLRARDRLCVDPYTRNRETGSFILVDETTNDTVAAGMVIDAVRRSGPVTWHRSAVERRERPADGLTLWLTGLSGAGKSTVATEVERRLVESGRHAYLLDGDNLRHGVTAGLGFGAPDRAENVRRVGEVAALFADAGLVSVVSLVSPYRADRDRVRERHAELGLPFAEVFVDTPLATCEARDPKGLYARARAGELTGFTGVDDPYEAPVGPDLHLGAPDASPADQAAEVVELVSRLVSPGRPAPPEPPGVR